MFASMSSVLVCVVSHFFLRVCGIYQAFGFGLALFRLGIWTSMLGKHACWCRMLHKMTVRSSATPQQSYLCAGEFI